METVRNTGIDDSRTFRFDEVEEKAAANVSPPPLPLLGQQRWKSSGNRRIRATVTIINMKKEKTIRRLEIWQPSAVDVFSMREEEKSISYFDYY